MMVRYRFDPALSRFTVQAFAAGMLSFLGHSPTFTVRDFTGALGLDRSRTTGIWLEFTIRAGGLELVDLVKTADRADIEDRMRREILETAGYPEITFRTADVAAHQLAPGRYRLPLAGTLSLRGINRPHRVDAELQVFDDGVRLLGQTGLRMSDYGIAPVMALGGTIRLQDEVKLVFDLAAIPEEA